MPYGYYGYHWNLMLEWKIYLDMDVIFYTFHDAMTVINIVREPLNKQRLLACIV